jgi:hypothetical protein
MQRSVFPNIYVMRAGKPGIRGRRGFFGRFCVDRPHGVIPTCGVFGELDRDQNW